MENYPYAFFYYFILCLEDYIQLSGRIYIRKSEIFRYFQKNINHGFSLISSFHVVFFISKKFYLYIFCMRKVCWLWLCLYTKNARECNASTSFYCDWFVSSHAFTCPTFWTIFYGEWNRVAVSWLFMEATKRYILHFLR